MADAALRTPPVVSRAWLGDVAAFLLQIGADDCWCDPFFRCHGCRARDLIQRAPVEALDEVGERDYATGRRVVTINPGVLL